jgi:predicted MPP superfamily phosphohydrolase
MKKYLLLSLLTVPFGLLQAQTHSKNHLLQIVFTSDLHYGYHRPSFAGADSVSANVVNAAMVAKINSMSSLTLPDDDGVGASKKISYIDYIAITGDIANRQQIPLQSDATSWLQFKHDFVGGVNTKNFNGTKTSFLLTPGNHDASNAVGYYKPMKPLTDATSMVGIYNMMMHPKKAKTINDFIYDRDKINYSRDIGGIHFMFVQLWPDSVNRVWMERDLKQVSKTTPVLLFTHVPPNGEVVHFTNPYYPYSINAKDKFENLLPEHLMDTVAMKSDKLQDAKEQKGFVAFLKKHPNIKAYFHGHENFTEFYNYAGPDKDISLPVFRVDSPMKGEYSAKDEKLLSFEMITIDTNTKEMTVREYLWNKHSETNSSKSTWGKRKTISLK